jgi:starch synthase
LRSLEVEPLVIAPRAPSIDPAKLNLARRLTVVPVPLLREAAKAEVWEWKAPSGVRVFFLEHPLFAEAKDHQDDPARAYVLCAGALGLVKSLGWCPDVVHSLGWPAALAPRLLQRAKDPFFAQTKTVMSLHDLRDQGVYSKHWVERLDLGWDGFHMGGFEFYDQLNFLKAGAAFADRLIAVSPRYAQDMQHPESGAGLEGLLRFRSSVLSGLLPGIDVESYDPRTDPDLAQNFTAQDFFGRRRCKATLQRLCKLPIRENRPLVALIGSAEPTGGLDRVLTNLEAIVATGCQVAVLLRGPGRALDEAFVSAALAHPDQIGVITEAGDSHERRALAGADLVILPHRFAAGETLPMKALRYGAVPVVSDVGGLSDVVNEGPQGCGFVFSHEEGALLAALQRGLTAYHDTRGFRQVQLRGMNRDHSWAHAALAYRDGYFSLVGRPIPEPESDEAAPLVESSRRTTPEPA